MAENISEVRLIYVPLERNYKHTLFFNNKDAQLNYFLNDELNSKIFKANDFSYIPQDSKLRVYLSLDEAKKYNYVVYRNTNYNNKYFFSFITDYEWKNDNLTELTIETDVIQTWLEECTIKPSFVEREHTKDDTIGANTLPENVEMGEYIVYKAEDLKPFKSLAIVMGTTKGPSGAIPKLRQIHGSVSGVYYYAVPLTDAGISSMNATVSAFASEGIVDAIKCMFLVPAEFIDFSTWEGAERAAVVIPSSATPYNAVFTFDMLKSFTDKYIPKNKKLFTYPYNYLLASNNNGASAIYQFEHFSEETLAFTIYGVLTPGCSIRLLPMNYKGVLLNDEEGLNLGKYPICNWVSDEYTNWLTQNSVNIGLNLASGLGQIALGGAGAILSGGTTAFLGGASVIGGINTIKDQLLQVRQMSFTAPQANGNINSGDVITSINKNTFSLYQMCIKPEYMKVIDEYFSMFGYKTNRVKVPEKNHRSIWWYTKTIDINIEGNIPVKDKEKICECYNNGITFWRNASYFKNYNLPNNIVGG